MRTRPLALLLCAAGTAATLGHAEGLQPAPVKLGGINIVPAISLKEQYDSNLFRQAEDEQEAWVQVLMLHMKALAQDGPHEYGLNYTGEAGYIENSTDDNYFDQSATAIGKWELGARHRFELNGGFRRDHDRRGTGYFQGDQATLIDEPPRFREEMFLSRYSYGADEAAGRLDFEVKGTNKTYLNFRELTRRNDLSNVYGKAAFLWRVTGTLRGLVETTQGKVDYEHDLEEIVGDEDVRDSTYATYLTGVTWGLAGKTTGTLKVGYATKDFDDSDRKDFSGTSWSGDLTWRPRTYSAITLSTGRRTDESNGRGDYIDATDYGIAWSHDWSDRIQSSLRYRVSDETYENDPDERDDTVHRYGFGVDYALQRWLAIGMFYTREQRESNIAQYDYPRDFTGLVLRASL